MTKRNAGFKFHLQRTPNRTVCGKQLNAELTEVQFREAIAQFPTEACNACFKTLPPTLGQLDDETDDAERKALQEEAAPLTKTIKQQIVALSERGHTSEAIGDMVDATLLEIQEHLDEYHLDGSLGLPAAPPIDFAKQQEVDADLVDAFVNPDVANVYCVFEKVDGAHRAAIWFADKYMVKDVFESVSDAWVRVMVEHQYPGIEYRTERFCPHSSQDRGRTNDRASVFCTDCSVELPFAVDFWGSHPDNNNDDCWYGDHYATLEDAERVFEAGPIPFAPDMDTSSVAFTVLDGPNVHRVSANPDFTKRDNDNDDDWRREIEREAGMLGGIDAYNDVRGYGLDDRNER